jgi:hypothetical protein
LQADADIKTFSKLLEKRRYHSRRPASILRLARSEVPPSTTSEKGLPFTELRLLPVPIMTTFPASYLQALSTTIMTLARFLPSKLRRDFSQDEELSVSNPPISVEVHIF